MPNICWFEPLRCKDIFGMASVKQTNKPSKNFFYIKYTINQQCKEISNGASAGFCNWVFCIN